MKENLLKGPVKIEDVLELGRIYEDKREVKKAIKVYLYGIKKLHSSSWKDIKKLGELNQIMIDLKKPSEEALLLAYKVATLYYDLYLVNTSSEELGNRILDTASKYFLICEFFNYKEAQTKYFLGMIYKEYGSFKKASLSFLESWKLFKKSKRLDDDLEQRFDLLLGESFLNYGYLDSGLALLREAYFYKNGNRYLQSYAKEYLNEFKGTSFGGSVGFLLGSDSNVLIGNDSASALIKSSAYSSKSGNLFLSHTPSYSSQYNLSLGFSDELFTEESLKDNDSRSLSLTASWDYKKYDKKVLSTRYTYSKNYSRPSIDGEFESDYDYHELSPTLKFYRLRNVFSGTAILSKSSFSSGDDLNKLGIGGDYRYLSFSKYWNPELRVELSSEEEEAGFERSKIISFGFANNLEFNESFSMSFDLSFERKTNSDSSLSYNDRALELSGYYSFEKIDGLGIDGSITSETSTLEGESAESRLKTSLGLSYYL